jgi:hypothetical protein
MKLIRRLKSISADVERFVRSHTLRRCTHQMPIPRWTRISPFLKQLCAVVAAIIGLASVTPASNSVSFKTWNTERTDSRKTLSSASDECHAISQLLLCGCTPANSPAAINTA